MPISDITPTVEMVAAIIRARTKSYGAGEIGTLNPAGHTPESERTRPTREQATAHTQEAMIDIVATFGANIPDAKCTTAGTPEANALRDGIKNLAALGAALIVELSYFPEQPQSERSPYEQLLKRYESAKESMVALAGRATRGCDGVSDEEPPKQGGFPYYGGFPMVGLGMEQEW